MPIRSKDRIAGLIQINDPRKGLLTIDQVALLEGIASHIGSALMRKKAEEALRTSEEKYRALVETTDTGYRILNKEGEVVDANKEYVRLSGHRELGDILGRSVIEWTAEHEKQRNAEAVAQCARDGFIRNLVIDYVDAGGRITPIEINATVIGSGAAMRIVSLCRGITERKRVESALQDKTRRLEDLTVNLEQRVQEEVGLRRKNEEMLAHQWRQPLNTLGLFIQDLKDAQAHGELDKQYLENTVQKSKLQIQHMSKTIDDFRNFFKPDKERADFETMEAVGHMLALFSAQLAAHDIDFRMTCHIHGKTFSSIEEIIPCREKTIHGYQNEFEHVILNLINNAREAIIEKREGGRMPRGGRGLLVFDFNRDDGRIIIEISNNGDAIPENILNRIFEPYFTTKNPAKGTGLGLYLSKVIIEDHMHGRLMAKNDAQGVVFIIELPLV